MAVAATINYEQNLKKTNFEPFAEWSLLAEMDQDEIVRARAAKFIGGCAVSQNFEILSSEPENYCLSDAISEAKNGDSEALKMVQTNIKTDLLERSIKTGLITEVEIETDENGNLSQFGQSLLAINKNSLIYASNNPKMKERTEAETLNAFRLESAYRQGLLEENSFLVFSLSADNMSQTEMEKAGFFTDTMTCSIQLVKKNQNGLSLETGFVSGVIEPGEHRHDIKTVVELAKSFGVDFEGKEAAEILANPILVPNQSIPNGVIDIIKDYDNQAGGTFFGSEKKLGDEYEGYKDKCLKREKKFNYMVDSITEKLLCDADRIINPQNAISMLNKLSEKCLVAYSVIDHEINPSVFGELASSHISQARNYMQQNNIEAANMEIAKATKVANSSSCPSGISSSEGSEEIGGNETKESSDSCSFISKECPECKSKNVHTTVTKTHIRGSCGCVKKKS